VIVLSSLDGVCCGSIGTLGAKMCFRESSDAVSCPVSHTRNKAIADLPESTLYYVDGGASSTTLLLDPCLLTTGIGAADIQVIMTTPFTEEEWANEVLTFEGAEASQTRIHEFRKTISFEHRNLAVPQSVRKKIAENRGKKVQGLDKLADHKQRAVATSQKGVESIVPRLGKSVLYQDSDSRVYIDAAESRSRHVADLAIYTSGRVEKQVLETDTILKEVTSSLLVAKMDIKATQTKVGTKPTSNFLAGLSLWDAVHKLVAIGDRTGLTSKLADKGVSLASGAYLDSVIRSSSGLSTILGSYKNHIMSLQTNVKSLMNSNLNGSSGLAMNTGSLPSAPPLAVPIHPSHPSLALIQKLEERIAILEKQTSAKQTVGNLMTVQFEGQLFNCQQDMDNYVFSLSGSSSVPVSLVNDCYTLLQAVVLSLQGDSIDIREIHSIGQMGSNISEADVRNAIAGN